MTAATVKATPDIAMPVPETLSLSPADNLFRAGITGRSEHSETRSASLSCALDLSKSRAHDAVLDILRAYKLTGNFHVNLEIVLKDIGVFDKVTYQIERNPKLSYCQDCRHVVFKPNGNVPNDMFGEIMRSIKARIGFDAPWWVRLFHLFYDKVDPPAVIARLDPKSGLPDFGIKLWKSETSDFDAIQYPLPRLLDRPVRPGDDSTGRWVNLIEKRSGSAGH